MKLDDIEQIGFEDGYYATIPRPPIGGVGFYMRGYWGGCHVRREEEKRLDVLAEQWAREDALSRPTDATP